MSSELRTDARDARTERAASTPGPRSLAAMVAGVGGIAFGVLTVVSLIVGSTPGGSYKVSDVTSFVAANHHPSAFVASYLAVLASVGLICLVAGLRRTIERAGNPRSEVGTVFFATGVASAASYAIGWVIALAVPIAYAFSAGGDPFSISTASAYLVVEIGVSVILGVVGVLLGICLLLLSYASFSVLPTWLRAVTAVAGVAGLASVAFFPWFALLLWSIIAGIWLLTSGRERLSATSPGPFRPS